MLVAASIKMLSSSSLSDAEPFLLNNSSSSSNSGGACDGLVVVKLALSHIKVVAVP